MLIGLSELLEVEEGHRRRAGELGQRAVPALDRLVLDEEGRQRLLEELVRLGLGARPDERRLRIALRLRDLRLRERLLALKLVLRLLRLLLRRHLLLQLLLDDVGQM